MSGRAGVAAAAWTTLAVLVGTGVPAAAVAPEGTDSAGAVGTTVTEVPLVVPPAAAAAARGPSPEAVVAARVAPTADRVLTDPIPMDDHQTLGLTWPAGADGGTLEPRVRVLADGEWSAWREVPHEEVTADPGTADAAHAGGARGGTESVWVGDAAEAVQLSFAATDAGGPDGLALVLVGSDLVAPTAATEPLAAGSLAGDLAAVAPVPQLVSRAEWGAAPQVCTPDVASRGLVGAVLHHTAGSNAYATQAEAMQQIRNDQRYHITGRGWCDLGYNFVVDKWGTVYEGRANSATQPVIGVHAGGFNTGTVGISMLGEYGALTPPAAVQESVARVVAWRLGQYHRDPAGWLTYRTLGGENSRFPAGTDVTLPVLFSHRDVGLTACPGNAGYQTLGWLRERARQLVGTTFVNPAATPTTLSPDTPVTVRAATLGDISWRLEVTHAVSGQLLASSVGYAQQAFGGVVASWDGRGPDGQYVGIGRYRLTLTGVDEAGRAVVPWTSTVSALRDPDPPTVDPVPLVGGLELVPVTPARLLRF